ncbi:MAG: NAD(P)/FAD-dependent oxidoreductase, partial [Archaeoglobaceae archaeon]|nr:NAD(P)/FAD-dependent oxidoreductase [Archaeoglobaceae archaeon]
EHKEIGLPVQCAEGWIRFSEAKPYIKGRAIKEVEIILLKRNYDETGRVKVKLNGAVEIVDRAKIEKKMASIAERKGVEIVTGVRIRKISEVIEMHPNCELIVDASGYPSLWCREFGGKKPYGPAVQAFTEKDIDRIVIMFHPDLNGYFWIFPKAEKGSKIGIGSFTKEVVKPLRKMLEEMMTAKKLLKEGFIPQKYTARPVACYRNSPFIRYIGKIPIALVGDAAGIVDKGGGEGITEAIISSRTLAECAKAGELEKYETKFYRKMRLHYLLADIFTFLRKHELLFRVFGKLRLYEIIIRALTSYYARARILED